MKLKQEILLYIILFCLLNLSGLRSGSHPNSLVPIIYLPNPVINADIVKPFTLTYVVIDDNPHNYYLKRDGEELESGRIRSSILNFTYSSASSGIIVFTLTVSDFSNNQASEDITVTISSLNQDVTTFAGHTFAEEYFAIEVDLVGSGTDVFNPDPEHPDLNRDLLDLGATTGDSNPLEDEQFYLAYMNMSGIETAFSALEKFEHMLTFEDFISDETYDDIWAVGALDPSLRDALEAPISHVNATAPFQQLVQHYTTSEASGYKDVFVTNNFIALIAYSTGTGSNPNKMDENDDLYLGYTFVVQNLTDAINGALIANGHSEDQLDNYEFESFFEKTDNGYEFGIKYTNILVLWQNIIVEPKCIDVFASTGDHSDHLKDNTGGVIFGGEIVVMSVLDYLSFNYSFETNIFSGVNEYIEGSVTTNYAIGETNFLAVQDETSIISDYVENWTNNPFIANPNYTLTIPDALADFDFSYYGLPNVSNVVTVDLPELIFFIDDDAKTRMRMENSLGLTIVTATTSFGIDVVDPEYEQAGDDINLNMGGKTYFFTEFTNKKTYKLLGLEDLWNINLNTDRPVEVIPFDPTGWGVADFGIAKAYFAVEFDLAYGFTTFMAKQTGEFMFMPPSVIAYLSVDLLYFTFTEFPEWYGGEIIHDPTYSVIAAMAAESVESSSTKSSKESEEPSDGVPGFDVIFLILGSLVLVIWKKSEKGEKS